MRLARNAFPFEGGQVTARRLRKQMTAYSEGALQTALENGCKDTASVVGFLTRREAASRARQLAGGRKGCKTTDRLLKAYGR